MAANTNSRSSQRRAESHQINGMFLRKLIASYSKPSSNDPLLHCPPRNKTQSHPTGNGEMV